MTAPFTGGPAQVTFLIVGRADVDGSGTFEETLPDYTGAAGEAATLRVAGTLLDDRQRARRGTEDPRSGW